MSDAYDFPSTPPLPPDQLPPIALQVSEPPLTEKRWSLAAALGFTVLTAAVTLGGGLLSAVLSAIPMVEGLSADAQGAITGSVLILAYGLLILAVWLAARRSGLDFAPAVGLRPVPVLATLGVALGIAFGARFLAGLYGLLLEALGVQLPGQNLDPTTLLPQTALGIALTIILACVVAPVAEELVFRGVLLSALHDRWGSTVA
ncbi:MAG TPA: CPBP family glutamic-type intramembrane protease, partial [Coriobacteriia bacterium]|nr:CPBP family glutamic-type intramembrane protease [Coriobacteriia bacterium]